METEIISETNSINPVIMAEVPAPIPVQPAPVDAVIDNVEQTDDRRFGIRRTENVDGSVSYGFTKDGSPRKRPGRKPKSSS